MDLQLRDKVIIVTDGARGIGEGIVNVLAKEDAIPVIVGHTEADNIELVEVSKSKRKTSFPGGSGTYGS